VQRTYYDVALRWTEQPNLKEKYTDPSHKSGFDDDANSSGVSVESSSALTEILQRVYGPPKVLQLEPSHARQLSQLT